MKFLHYWFLLSICLCWHSASTAQNQPAAPQVQKERLEAIFKVKDGNIHLRWAPSTPGLWLALQRGKVIVQRQSWKTGQFDPSLPMFTISDTLSVWTSEQYENLTDEEQSNAYLMLAGYCMHAPYESIREEKLSLESIVDRDEELNNRFSSALFAADRDPLAAQSMALSFVDKQPDLSLNHAYHILLLTEDKKVYQTKVHYNPQLTYAFKPTISRYSEEEKMVVLAWDKAAHSAHYSAYWIERSSDNQTFKRLNTIPYVHASDEQSNTSSDDYIYMDTVQNYVPYYYRIIGMDAFGDESTPSNSVLLMGKDRTPPAIPSNPRAEMHLDHYMNVQWSSDENAEDLTGYYIKKSLRREGPFESISPLLPVDQQSFKDKTPHYLYSNFYQVCAVDTARNEACTSPIYGILNDTIPPQKPQNLTGTIDSSGVVSLSWEANKEFDLKGYNVYFANKWNRVFTILNDQPLPANQFQDTINLNSLTEDIYYRVVAIDQRNNLSSFSDMIQLFKPDTIPPGPAIFTGYVNDDEGVRLEWAPSSSKDVVAHLLYRAAKNESFSLIKELTDEDHTYFDQNIRANTTYTYRIQARDDSGLHSSVVNDLRVHTKTASVIPDFKLTALTVENTYILKFSVQEDMDFIGELALYIQENEGPFRRWKTISIQESPMDIIVTSPKNNKYKGRLIHNSGQKSTFSPIVGF